MKLIVAGPRAKLPVSAAAMANRSATSAEASFISASPWRICMSRRGMAVRPETDETASASVGESTAPSAKPTDSGTPGMIQCTK